MLTKGIDKKNLKIGLVHEIYTGDGPTGYEIEMIIRSKIERYHCSQDVYDYIDNGRFGNYPNAAELFYALIFNAEGIIVQLMQADNFQNEENALITTTFSFGTYAMFRYAIDENTPKVGEFLSIDGSVIRLSDDFTARKDSIIYVSYAGAIQEPKSKMMFKMADDFDVYTWDWGDAKQPFSITCTKEEAKANDFVTSFKVGKPEDIADCYWVTFDALHGDGNVIDTVCCFKNKAPGWTY